MKCCAQGPSRCDKPSTTSPTGTSRQRRRSGLADPQGQRLVLRGPVLPASRAWARSRSTAPSRLLDRFLIPSVLQELWEDSLRERAQTGTRPDCAQTAVKSRYPGDI
jgi:hypothetical protein